jgi:hypothetical protein
MSSARTPFGQQRTYGVIRSALIGYGVAAFTYLFSRSSALESTAGQVFGSAQTLVLVGLALQVLLIGARMLARRRAEESQVAEQGLMVLELVADGVTVLLFAMATLGTIIQASGNV